MKLAIKLLTLFIATALVAQSGAITQDQAKAKARSVSGILGMPFDENRVTANSKVKKYGKLWYVQSGETLVMIDDQSGAVTLAANMALMNGKGTSSQSGSALMDEPKAWRKSDALLQSISRPSYLVRNDCRFSNPNPASKGPRRHIIVRYHAKPNGIPSFGNGNKAIFTFDRTSQSVVSMELRAGWSYQGIKPKVTETEARSTARKKLNAQITSTTLGYFAPNSEFGGAYAEELRRSKVCRLAWSVTTSIGTVTVDAQNGRVIGGGRFAQAKPATRTQTGTRTSYGEVPSADGADILSKFLRAAQVPAGFWKQKTDLVKGGFNVTYLQQDKVTTEVYWKGSVLSLITVASNYSPVKPRKVTSRVEAEVFAKSLAGVLGLKFNSLRSFDLSKGERRTYQGVPSGEQIASFSFHCSNASGGLERVTIIVMSKNGRLVSWRMAT